VVIRALSDEELHYHLNVGAEDESGEMGDLLRDMSGPSHEFFVGHVPSVTVLVLMSTGLA
jgi:hypothetical protein